ncbi:MAG: DUF6503 family protein [Cyclobacteriaceae bacterium]
MKHFFLVLLLGPLFGFMACNSPETSSAPSSENTAPEYPALLQEALEAHGGLDTWQSFGQLAYDVYRGEALVDHQLIALPSRKVFIENEQYNIGFDGQQVWVSPDTSAYPGSSARFYHNLQFYFFALPFVLADPGIHYEVLEPREFQGTTYDVLKVTYEANVGDASNDEYIAYFDPSSHQLHLLLYTVTYFSQSPGENYNARLYQDWQTVNGLQVPQRVLGYRWEADSLGEPRGTTEYRNVVLDKTAPDPGIFQMPEEASIADIMP